MELNFGFILIETTPGAVLSPLF